MLIGIKYCGGCNVQYDRSGLVRKLMRQPGHEYVKGEEPCDLLVIVCGCARACPNVRAGNAKHYRILTSEKDFQELFLELKHHHQKEHTETELTVLKPGQKAQITKRFNREDVLCFAELTGDTSGLHIDEEFAGKQWFGKPVVHGVLAGSLISSVMGSKLPGPGTILVREEIDFLKPVFYGDQITAQVEFKEYEEERLWYKGKFAGQCVNQRDEITAEAEVWQILMKNLFVIEKGDKK